MIHSIEHIRELLARALYVCIVVDSLPVPRGKNKTRKTGKYSKNEIGAENEALGRQDIINFRNFNTMTSARIGTEVLSKGRGAPNQVQI